MHSSALFRAHARAAVAVALLSVGFVVACSSGSSSGSSGTNARSFVDAKNRRCSYVGSGANVKCDVAPTPSDACTAPATACFTINGAERATIESPAPDAGDVVTVSNCAACCTTTSNSETSIFTNDDCSDLVCTTDVDCVGTTVKCVNGKCTRPR